MTMMPHTNLKKDTNKYTHAKKAHLKIHGNALRVKYNNCVRTLFENFNVLAAWKPRNEKYFLYVDY